MPRWMSVCRQNILYFWMNWECCRLFHMRFTVPHFRTFENRKNSLVIVPHLNMINPTGYPIWSLWHLLTAFFSFIRNRSLGSPSKSIPFPYIGILVYIRYLLHLNLYIFARVCPLLANFTFHLWHLVGLQFSNKQKKKSFFSVCFFLFMVELSNSTVCYRHQY